MVAHPLAEGQVLHAHHRADLLASGLSDKQIHACGFYTESDPAAVAKLLRWEHPATVLGPCLCIPYYNADGKPSSYTRAKPSHPRLKDDKPIKYESPVGEPNRLYIPPATRTKITDANIPLVIAEGEKKSAAADQHGIACVGLVGAYGWCQKREADADGQKHGERKLVPDLEAIPWVGRTVYVIYDSDAATNPKVLQAESHLVTALQARGAVVYVVRLPVGKGGAKVGLAVQRGFR